MKYIKYILVGIFFGFVLTKSEAISWFRIQEMFRFQSIHMYGLMGSAVLVGMSSLLLIRKFNIKSFAGETIKIKDRPFTKGTVIGGLLFGFGWVMTGACPGPIYTLIGNGFPSFIVALISAIFGVYLYGVLKDKLPH